jgi:glycosyltransferase involved in cell wall biosynthesis
MPCVTTIHDILHVKGIKYFSFLQRLYARKMIAHACKSSAAVIVDSEFTKRELLDVFRINDRLVHVVHLGVSPLYSQIYSEADIKEFRNEYGIVKPAILYIGSLKPHKNVEILIAAYANLKHRSEFQLVFSGESIMKQSLLWKMISDKRLAGDIVDIGQISQKKLALAYRAAAVVVLPSLYEGFGFSVLEAMASGTPAIGARTASIPEVMGNGGILFDPNSAEELTFALEKVMSDTEFRTDVIQRGFKNVSRFSWEKCAEQTFQIYKEVV